MTNRIGINKSSALSFVGEARREAHMAAWNAWGSARAKLCETRAQGTTEYAILVGVLVVIAVLAIALFRGKIEQLWNDIVDGINGL